MNKCKMAQIYLDNNATTQLDPIVIEAMMQALQETPANPSSMHHFGQKARYRLLQARERVAAYFSVKPQDILFTSGGTEAMNFLIRGMAQNLSKGQILSSNVEHPCVYQTLDHLAREGWDIRYLPAGTWGGIRRDQVREAITDATRMIVLAAANSETGVKNEIRTIAKVADAHEIPLIVDGVALLGKETIDLYPGIQGIGFSSHKIHGPAGVGLAIIRSHIPYPPLLFGGPQEYGRRGGTENLAAIVGFATAIELLVHHVPDTTTEIERLRNLLQHALVTTCGAIVNGQGPRICNTLNVRFPHGDGETLLMQLDLAGIAASHGSACTAGALEPSRVLLNMGLSMEEARSSLRFSLSRYTTESDILETISILNQLFGAIHSGSRSLSLL